MYIVSYRHSQLFQTSMQTECWLPVFTSGMVLYWPKNKLVYSWIIFSTSENMVSGICYGFVVSVVLFIKVISYCQKGALFTSISPLNKCKTCPVKRTTTCSQATNRLQEQPSNIAETKTTRSSLLLMFGKFLWPKKRNLNETHYHMCNQKDVMVAFS